MSSLTTKKQMNNMPQILLSTVLFLCVSLFATAQNKETRSLSSFHGVSASASVNAILVKGNKNEVAIEAYETELEDVKTEIEDGILKVGMKSKNKWSMNWSSKRKVNVTVTYTDDLDYIGVSSSADLTSKDVISGDDLKISVSSSGDMTIEIDVDNLTASISSSGDLNISGSANFAEVSGSSSADFNGKNLKVINAEVSASSSADISIYVSESLKASASSSGDIEYYGNPTKKDISKSSGGDVDGHN